MISIRENLTSAVDLAFVTFKDGASLPIKKYFCVVCDYAKKADLCNGYWNLKRKLEVTAYFLEIIK